MSLSYINSRSPAHSGPRRALDDNYIRAPVILAAEQVNPLTTSLNAEYTSRTWRLATVGKDILVDGRRLENALWRVWAQQRLGLRRLDDMEIDWEKLTAWKHKSLLGPVVISHETCIRSIELSVASTMQNTGIDHLSDTQVAIPPSADELTVPSRPCLRRRSTSPGDAVAFHSSLEERSPSTFSRSHRVVFNKCVVQCIIKEDWESSEPDEISDFELDTPSLEEPHSASDSYSFPRFIEDFDAPSQYQEESSISRCATIIASNSLVASIEPLPPIQLHPALVEEGKDGNVVFVPPPGMEGLSEAELLPYEKSITQIQRSRSSTDLTPAEKEDIAMESQLEDLSVRGAGEFSSDEPVVLTKKRRVRRRRSKGLFMLDGEDEVTKSRGRTKRNEQSHSASGEESVSSVRPSFINSPVASVIVDDFKPTELIQRKVDAMLDQLTDTGGKIGQLVSNLWS